jgi:hypothetical protein
VGQWGKRRRDRMTSEKRPPNLYRSHLVLIVLLPPSDSSACVCVPGAGGARGMRGRGKARDHPPRHPPEGRRRRLGTGVPFNGDLVVAVVAPCENERVAEHCARGISGHRVTGLAKETHPAIHARGGPYQCTPWISGDDGREVHEAARR